MPVSVSLSPKVRGSILCLLEHSVWPTARLGNRGMQPFHSGSLIAKTRIPGSSEPRNWSCGALDGGGLLFQGTVTWEYPKMFSRPNGFL